MAGGDVITKGASSKRTTSRPKAGTRAGGDVITKGATKKSKKSKSSKKR
jgi:hypothetical protein